MWERPTEEREKIYALAKEIQIEEIVSNILVEKPQNIFSLTSFQINTRNGIRNPETPKMTVVRCAQLLRTPIKSCIMFHK